MKKRHTILGSRMLGAFTSPFGQGNGTRLGRPLSTTGRTIVVERWRTQLIVSRVFTIAVIFAVLTPLWGVVDFLAFGPATSVKLFAGRLATTIAFVFLAWQMTGPQSLARARSGLAILTLLPVLVYFSFSASAGTATGPLSSAVMAGYALLPFIVVAGLGLFPLTMVESALFSLPVLAAFLLVPIDFSFGNALATNLGAAWILLLLAVIAAITGTTQVRSLIAFVDQTAHDPLTGCLSRSVVEDLLDAIWNSALRRSASLSIAFVDLDGLKQINDQYGHQIGDRVLEAVAKHLREGTRGADLVIRWGGDEFLLLLPDTDVSGAYAVTKRLQESGLGERPDGMPQTASFGLAERIHDGAGDWAQIVHEADLRMYAAKRAGGDRIVGPELAVQAVMP